MKALLFIFALSVAGVAIAAEPISIIPGRPESRYGYTNAVLNLSSSTVSSIPETNGYRQIIIPNTLSTAATFYFRADGVNTNVATTGFPVTPNCISRIESNQEIFFILEPGMASRSIRYLERKK